MTKGKSEGRSTSARPFLGEKSAGTGRFVERAKKDSPSRAPRRVILFPTEPTSIDPERIKAAVELVISRNNSGKK